MSWILAFGLQFRPVRRLFGRIRWPRPDQLDRLTDKQMRRYIRDIGIEAEAQAILAPYRRLADQSEARSAVRIPEGQTDRPAGAPVP